MAMGCCELMLNSEVAAETGIYDIGCFHEL